MGDSRTLVHHFFVEQFEVRSDSLFDVGKGLFDGLAFADAARESGDVDGVSSDGGWFKDDVEMHRFVAALRVSSL